MGAAKCTLSVKDYILLQTIINEWHGSPDIEMCFSIWQNMNKPKSKSTVSFLHALCFNVRGLDPRWEEIMMLTLKENFDVIILLETGKFDTTTMTDALPQYNMFYQKGENSHNGVLVLVRQNIRARPIPCDPPNVCAIDLHVHEIIRLVEMCAPESKTWTWNDLSKLISTECVLLGDFNVDLEEDVDKAQPLLAWADSLSLAPFSPDQWRRNDFSLGKAQNLFFSPYVN
ncbi:unnamed protein product [Didymodactylos carnosus]|uniref:Endonuclease/exonuclease/phosphatase domain-containing protein n=1 Tax=Didymodactylos carnosus TaxID=1234261 RepID=A0A815FR13_9BILA|nr:unnamed protein product [Didymodactylos carnosus]CAF1329305.1 unnamed protein product [Didymodactylos carnosus]CAF3753288.1 unnamed protein product [Didymodactylos carnosus]CAF4181541.1 unnamed protein product [Didymodactylos carnosus]